MWNVTQYYNTKFQLVQMDLEEKMDLLPGRGKKAEKNKSKKKKSRSGIIAERLQALDSVDAEEEEWEMNPETEPENTASTENWMNSDSENGLQQGTGEAAPETEQLVPEAPRVLTNDTKTVEIKVLSAEELQERMIWTEILGDPVSRKRRKKRVNQLYGNQGNAYRR